MKEFYLRYARQFKDGVLKFQIHSSNFPTALEIFDALGRDLDEYDNYGRKRYSAVRDFDTDIIYFHDSNLPMLFSINPKNGSWGTEKAFNDTINVLNESLKNVFGSKANTLTLIEEAPYEV